MKATRFVLGAALVSSLFWLIGCGQGTYRIPAVEPVVKPKPENDLLEDIEGGDKSAPSSTESKPSAPATEKPAESKPPESKPEEPKSEPKPADPGKAEPAKAEPKSKPAKPSNGKPTKK
jgi:hypothetical protein